MLKQLFFSKIPFLLFLSVLTFWTKPPILLPVVCYFIWESIPVLYWMNWMILISLSNETASAKFESIVIPEMYPPYNKGNKITYQPNQKYTNQSYKCSHYGHKCLRTCTTHCVWKVYKGMPYSLVFLQAKSIPAGTNRHSEQPSKEKTLADIYYAGNVMLSPGHYSHL